MDFDNRLCGGYMRSNHEDNQTRFFGCFALAIFAATLAAFSKNLFTFFVAYELMTVSTYPLVTHHGTDEARRGGRVYLGILFSTSIGLLLLALYGLTVLLGRSTLRQVAYWLMPTRRVVSLALNWGCCWACMRSVSVKRL
jgi:formate hydrogenlyase subunit 3/multisubunit Na+/H+ antiporter MnhD subunit